MRRLFSRLSSIGIFHVNLFSFDRFASALLFSGMLFARIDLPLTMFGLPPLPLHTELTFAQRSCPMNPLGILRALFFFSSRCFVFRYVSCALGPYCADPPVMVFSRTCVPFSFFFFACRCFCTPMAFFRSGIHHVFFFFLSFTLRRIRDRHPVVPFPPHRFFDLVIISDSFCRAHRFVPHSVTPQSLFCSTVFDALNFVPGYFRNPPPEGLWLK